LIRVWRLTNRKRAGTAFSGEGARLYGGRWNRKGVLLVYTAGSQALALLEMLVQDGPLRARYVVIPADIPDDLAMERVRPSDLPPDWTSPVQLDALREIGGRWVIRGKGAVLAVPSAVVPAETNYLLNPAHPEFRRIRIGKPDPFTTDLRLLKKTKGT
jgi:RES domain-containing protein